MRTIKFMALLVGMLLTSVLTFGQEVTIKDVKFASSDITASVDERKDAAGNVCAVVKVQIPSVKDVRFSGGVVGKPKYSSGEYIVYVSPGIKTLTISDDGVTLCVVDFAERGIEVMSKCTYQVVLAQEQALDKVFKIEPATATLSVNGQNVVLGEGGLGSFECEVGKVYNYIISAPGYETVEDAFMISPEEEAIEPINVTLERKMAMVKFLTNVDEVEIWIGDESWGIAANNEQIELPVGTWNIRLVADKHEDWMDEVTVNEQSNVVDAQLKKSENVSKKLRTRTSFYVGGGVAFPLESRTDMTEENVKGYPVRLGFDWEIFIKRWFTFRPGLEFMALCGNDIKVNDRTPFSVNIPLVFSMNAPLGKFNRNHFSVGLGPVVGYASLLEGNEKESNIGTSTNDSEGGLLIGGRVEARFTFNHFVLGVNVEYLNSKDVIGGDGLIAPMVSLGYKF